MHIKKSILKNTYFLYTCSFLLLLPIVFLPFLTTGKSFIWDPDGLDQHYPTLMHYGKLLRDLFSGKGFPMMDFKIGLGFDTSTTLNYYVLGDPLTLLTVFMNSDNSVFFYNLLILIRFYLAGISFILLMKYFQQDVASIVLGALIYVFSGYSLYAGIRHPFFMNPMIYLPLILIGVEQVYRRKKPYLIIGMAFICTMSNFYFFYNLTIITSIYVIFRYFTLYHKKDKNKFIGLMITGFRIGGYYLFGAVLASFIFLPVIYAFIMNGRLNISPQMIYGYLYYGANYYLSFYQSLFAPGVYPGYWTILSFSSVSIISFAVLIGNKKYWQLHIFYLLTLMGLFIPAFGYFMNGFSYTANRWCYLISLLVAVTFTLTYDKLFRLEKKEKKILFALIAFYGILAFTFPSKHIVKMIFLTLLFIMIMILILQMKYFKRQRKVRNTIFYILVFLSLGLNGYGFYSNQYNDYTHEFLSEDEVKKHSSQGALTLLSDINDQSFYRIETYGDKAVNESLILGFHDVSGYYSLMDGSVTSYLKELEVLDQSSASRFDNLDNRTALDALASVKYFITTNKSAAPFGYERLKKVTAGTKKYYLFENLYALPLGYTYENYMLKDDYNKLNALEKQNVMLSSVILNQNTDYAVKTNNVVNSGIEKLKVQIAPDANVIIKNNIIDVKKSGATITLKFDAKPNSETYVRFGKLNINKKQNVMLDFKARGILGMKKKINVRSEYYNSYFGKENYLINTGYSETGKSWVVITFPEIGTFRYDSLEVFNVDMSNYINQLTALSASSLSNIKRYNNSLEGDIKLDKKEIMALSIPYSKGWSATVDGVKSVLLNANVMYMALPLEAGQHHIILKYETPYLKIGAIVSFIAFLILIGMMIYSHYSKDKS